VAASEGAFVEFGPRGHSLKKKGEKSLKDCRGRTGENTLLATWEF